ncbi:MAG TPA: tyrosine--tRNA ligase, partial [Synergistales bacterium]|nr:tyrosine--tRNA ligase [Synergistales bacterium]
MQENALDLLQKRGYIEWCSNPEELKAVFRDEMVTAYVGFDPTASSLHVGHLIPIMGLAWLQKLGHRPICIAGGGTGMIGDPSFKSKERVLLTLEAIEKNIEGVGKQLEHFMDFHGGPNSAIIVNNYTWLNSMTFLEFLRDVGKHFTINYMIAKEHVRSRLDDPEKSISFTEFSYSLLQAYDFYHLFKTYGCRLQMGGNDQQGNIVSGIELVRRKEGVEVFGGTNPLLLNSSGTKFGKTEEGAVWLDPDRTSPYRFYQFWINTEDEQIEKLLKLFTFLDLEEIDEIVKAHFISPEKRQAQKRLAWEVTSIVHGENAAKTAQRASEILFGGSFDPSELDSSMLEALCGEVPYADLASPVPLLL